MGGCMCCFLVSIQQANTDWCLNHQTVKRNQMHLYKIFRLCQNTESSLYVGWQCCCSEGPQQVREMGWWKHSKVQHWWIQHHSPQRGQLSALVQSGGQLATEQPAEEALGVLVELNEGVPLQHWRLATSTLEDSSLHAEKLPASLALNCKRPWTICYSWNHISSPVS